MFACNLNDPYCSRKESANARRIGVVPPDAKGRGGEAVWSAPCTGLGDAIFKPELPHTPLFATHLCHVLLHAWWPKDAYRWIWVKLFVRGPSGLPHPSGVLPQNFVLRLVP